MKDFSHFIHEEIFLIDPQSEPINEKAKKAPEIETSSLNESDYRLGIIAQDVNDDEKQLLSKILEAISIDPSSVLFSDQIDTGINNWIVFSDSFEFIDKELQHFTISDVNGTLIIASKPLKTLKNSVDEKGKLWSLLKGHFNS